MEIYRYTLKAKSQLNAKTDRQEYEGALIRLGGGYACLHPWPELGDPTLDELLDGLKKGRRHPMLRAALHCVEMDAMARKNGVSLFDGLDVPQSHATIPLDESAFQSAINAGFQTVKVKMGRSVDEESEMICQMAHRYPEIRWRIDFNNTMKREQVESLLSRWSTDLLQQIDFLEDAYKGARFSSNRVPLAVDREVEEFLEDYNVAVIKPAINNVDGLLERAEQAYKRVVITSYMDHPLGQSYAAWQAAKAVESYPWLIETCGLVTHGLFEPNAFTEALGVPSPSFSPASGTGLGFDVLLGSLPWKSFS